MQTVIVCRQRRSGNRRAGPVLQRRLTQEIILPPLTRIMMGIILTITILRGYLETPQHRWEVLRRTRGACMICTAMCVNGVGIVMGLIPSLRKLIQWANPGTLTVWFAAGLGSMVPVVRVPQIGATSLHGFGTKLLASALCVPRTN